MHDIAPYTLLYLAHGKISPATYTGAILPFPQQYPKYRRWKITLEIAGKVCWIKKYPYLCNVVIGTTSSESFRQASSPKWMPVLFSRNLAGGRYCNEGSLVLQLEVIKPIMKKRTKQRIIVHFSTRVDVVKLVKVRSYRRIRNGKVERVRSHYRRY